MRTYLTLLTALTLLVVPFPTGRLPIDVPTVAHRTTILGYERAEFGPGWAAGPDRCDTRTRVMASAFSASNASSASSADCARPWSQWDVEAVPDPYTGSPLLPHDVEIDHILPVSAAWDLGAHRWDAATRVRFYNDPTNLIAVSSAANQAKGDKLPSEWMPEARRSRCAYGHRMVDVAKHYALPLPRADMRAIRRSCSGVAGLIARREL